MMTQQLPVRHHFVMFGGCLNQHHRQRLTNVFTFRQGHFGEAARVQASKNDSVMTSSSSIQPNVVAESGIIHSGDLFSQHVTQPHF